MQGIFSNFWLRDDLGLQRMCCYKAPLGIGKKIRLFVRNPAGSHQSKSRCTEKKEKKTEIQSHE